MLELFSVGKNRAGALVSGRAEFPGIPPGEAVNEALPGLQHRLLNEQLQPRVDRELGEGEAPVSKTELRYWDHLSDA